MRRTTLPAPAGGGNLWYCCNGCHWSTDGFRVFRVDPATNQIIGTVRIPGTPNAMAAGAGAVWIAVTSN